MEVTNDMWGVGENEEVQKEGTSFGGEALFQQLQEASKAEAERRYARWAGLRSRDEGVGRAGCCSWESLGEGEWPWEGQGNFGDDGGRDDGGEGWSTGGMEDQECWAMLNAAVGGSVWADIPPQKRAKMWHAFEEAGRVGGGNADVSTGGVEAERGEAWLGVQERGRNGFQDADGEDAFEQLEERLNEGELPGEDPLADDRA